LTINNLFFIALIIHIGVIYFFYRVITLSESKSCSIIRKIPLPPRAKELCRIQEGGNLVAHYIAACQIWRETLVPICKILYRLSRHFFISFSFSPSFLPSRNEHANFLANTRGTGGHVNSTC